MTFEETLTFLYEKLPMFQRIGKTAFKKDLSNTIKLCEALGNPQNKIKCIHIAGTNGKGSTAHALASVFMEAGYKTGLYTSPHLKSFTERIKLNGKELDEQYVIDFVQNHKSLIEEVKPSFFEITVVMAFDYFAKHQPDICLIEVGMGGRFDSTNVINPLLSIITSIGLDHQEYLGYDLESIAFEKAGIIKKNRPVCISNRHIETDKVFIQKAEETNSPIYFAEDEIIIKEIDNKIYINSKGNDFHFEFGLKGAYQQKNIPGIIKSLELSSEMGFKIRRENIMNGLSRIVQNTGIKGRWQVLQEKPMVICDTGHNIDALNIIFNQISSIPHEKLFLLLGFVNDKELDAVFDLFPQKAQYIFSKANIPRAKNLEEISEMAEKRRLNFKLIEDVNEAYSYCLNLASAKDLVFVGGSTFIVAELNSL